MLPREVVVDRLRAAWRLVQTAPIPSFRWGMWNTAIQHYNAGDYNRAADYALMAM